MIALGAVRGPLDASFTIPGVGIVISVRSLLKTLCAAADMDRDLCALINSKPEQACTALVAKGDKWIKARIAEAFDVMIAQVLDGIDCQKKNWKEYVIDAFDISFSNEGISIEIDESAILQNVICALARKAIDLSLEGPVNLAVRKLKDACAALAKSKASTASTAQTATKAPPSSAEVNAAALRIQEALEGYRPPVATWSAIDSHVPVKSNAWLWWAGGTTVVAGGFLWLFAKKRKS